MANWGVPDFDKDSAKERAISDEAETLRARLQAAGKMTEWSIRGPAGYDHATVRRYCVDTSNPEVQAWQSIRLSMKGKDTAEKLAILKAHWDRQEALGRYFEAAKIQVYNYLGALRRGGQLDDQNRVRKRL